ncbi:MAG TPA: hypothetical protein VFD33_02025 [Bacillota bacterium]|nr:hypothetical protein [Bacillota bacterium]
MTKRIKLKNLTPKPWGKDFLKGYRVRTVDLDYLKALGLEEKPSDEVLTALQEGSALFKKRLESGKLIPQLELDLREIDINGDLEIHNYTGSCPTLTYEINPVSGCNVGCLYCLVTDGIHEQPMLAYTNYNRFIRGILDNKHTNEHYYYFSPKTEAFQESTLQTGIAHNILRAFIDHYEAYPDSRARLFIASKAGSKHLQYEHKGDSIIGLLAKLRGRAQFNTSVSIMPADLRSILEPYGASIDERLEAVSLCQDRGILSESALVQPILLPYLTEENMHEFFSSLQGADIINYKPEFLTLCMENLAMVGQLLGIHDKAMELELYKNYISPDNADHKKQRDRTAPSRKLSRDGLSRLMEVSSQYGLTTSICYWVRQQLEITEQEIPLVNKNGYQCLGYQTKLFNN